MKKIFPSVNEFIKGIILISGLLVIINIPSFGNDDKFKNIFKWEEIASIPPPSGENIQHGLATPFAGFSNGAIIVAGGCNFPDEPVYDGGIKKYYDNIFVYDED